MPRKQHTFHFIYKTTCLITNKFYIGMHSTSNIDDGYMGSGLKVKRSLNKYGIKNHKIEHLQFFSTREELKKREAELVNESLLQDPLCMNLKLGGEGGWDHIIRDPESCRKKLIIGREKFHKMIKENHEFWKKIYEKGNNTRKEKNDNLKKLGIKCNQNWIGKHHSEESKRKIGLANSKMKGIKNSQYGTCWIHSLIQKRSLQIKKDQLQFYLEQGWIKGRKIKFK